MSQFKRIFCCGFMVSILGLLTGAPLAAAEPQAGKANWDSLKQLSPGEEIQVVLNDAKAFQGKFQSVSDEALVIRLDTGEQNLTRQSILRVSSKGQSHRLRNAAIGAAIGFGAGAVIGATAGNSSGYCCGRDILVPGVGVLGLAIGGVTGAVLPTGGWRDVYRAH